MNIFKRLFRILQTKANAIVNNPQDPVDTIEQKLEEMKEHLSENLDYLRKIKALAIGAKNDKDNFISKAKTYEDKAIAILKRVQHNEMIPDEGNRLAKEALMQKEALLIKIKAITDEQDRLDYKVELLKGNINIVKSNISNWESELKILKEDLKIRQVERNLKNGDLDTQNIDRRLKFLKEKTTQYQQLKEQHNDTSDDYINLDDDIDFTIDKNISKADEELKKLKEQIGLKNSN